MKKLKIILATLFTIGLAFSFVSCDDLINSLTEEEDSGSTTNMYEFKLTDGTELSTFVYYTSTEKFTYTSPTTNETYDYCQYQLSFNVGKKTWILYTRPVKTSSNLDTVASGTYTGDLFNDGDVVLTYSSDYASIGTSETVTVSNKSFELNVYAAHKAMGAADAK